MSYTRLCRTLPERPVLVVRSLFRYLQWKRIAYRHLLLGRVDSLLDEIPDVCHNTNRRFLAKST